MGSDSVSETLSHLSKRLGNETLGTRLADANAQQRALLDFIIQRLQTVQKVQSLELQEMRNQNEWFRQVASGHEGYSLPDATRWHNCARTYQKAGEAISRGDLGRGAQLLERAAEEERDAQRDTPAQVREHLDPLARTQVSLPAGTVEMSTATVCNAITSPTGLKLADHILNISDVMEDSAPIRRIQPKNWWEIMEEEEDSDDSTEGIEPEEDEVVDDQ